MQEDDTNFEPVRNLVFLVILGKVIFWPQYPSVYQAGITLK